MWKIVRMFVMLIGILEAFSVCPSHNFFIIKVSRHKNDLWMLCSQVIECVLQVLKSKKESVLCVCAPSNYAADILCRF